MDFTEDVWVALFFATHGGLEERAPKTEGRIWSLDRAENSEDLEILDVPGSRDIESARRWARQGSVLVRPATGEVPRRNLREETRISSDAKEGITKFLDMIGVTRRRLFDDLEGYIRYEQEYASMGVYAHMATRWLEVGEEDKAMGYAEAMAQQESELNRRTGHYICGLCHAWAGRLEKAKQDMERFARAYQKAGGGKSFRTTQRKTWPR